MHAAEKGIPLLGALPFIFKNKLDIRALHDKHGPRFRINTGPLAGEALAIRETEDVRAVLEDGAPFDSAWPGVVP